MPYTHKTIHLTAVTPSCGTKVPGELRAGAQGLTREVCEDCQDRRWPQAASSTPTVENTDQRWSESQDLSKRGAGAMGGHHPGHRVAS